MMPAPLLLGIDVGTSSAKAVLIDAAGRVLGAATVAHPTHAPAPGYYEQEAADWWQGACSAVRQVMAETGANPASVAGISLSGQGCACLPVDQQGEPLARAPIWTDARAGAQQRRIRQTFGADLGRVAGNDIYDQPEPRMMWFRDEHPELYARTACFLSTVSYLLLSLTGKLAANTSDWGFHLALDRRRKAWNETFLAGVGLTTEKFPALYAPTEVVGTVTGQAAAECGLQAGTPVVAGGQDSTVSALAVGALEAGQSVYMRGTTDLLSVCVAQPDYQPGLYTSCAVLPDLYMRYDMREVVAAGGAMTWLARMLFGEAGDARYEEIGALAEGAPPGAGGVIFLPYLLMSTKPDPAEERSSAFFGLTVNTGRSDLCRALMEGTAYAMRESLDFITALGIPIADLRPTGGPTRSRLWNQITADVTGLPVLLPGTSAGAAYGAALLAGLGVGVYPLDDGYAVLRGAIRLEQRYDPQPQTAAAYGGMYDRFVRLARTTAGIGQGRDR